MKTEGAGVPVPGPLHPGPPFHSPRAPCRPVGEGETSETSTVGKQPVPLRSLVRKSGHRIKFVKAIEHARYVEE